jgi:hypothetical protein
MRGLPLVLVPDNWPCCWVLASPRCSDGGGVDCRKGSHRNVSHRLSAEERQRILLTCNEPEFAALPPGQIVPILADRGLFIGSERSFYRVLHAHGQANRLGRARPPQEPRLVPRLRAAGPNQVWSWDITYLPTNVRGVWLYLYLVIDVWNRKVVVWDVAEREDSAIAADLVSRACLRERISKSRQQPLILHADNGKFVTPQQRHSGQAVAICRHRAHVYEQARQQNPRRWSRSTRCWRQPEVVWINPPQPEFDPKPATFAMAA